MFKKCLSCCLSFVFCFTSLISPANAQYSFNHLPLPGAVTLSETFAPVMAKGMTVNLDNPFQLDFIIHPGDASSTEEEFQNESMKLVKYFLAALTVPEEELWVNLSPYEKDRIIPEGLGQTEMGRDLLAQDYILKQLTASLMNPENEEGKKFWEKVYESVYKDLSLRGAEGDEAISEIASQKTLAMTVETFNKVWIVPSEARIYEHKNSAFVVESKLKVMLEEDYFAQEQSKLSSPVETGLKPVSTTAFENNSVKQIIRQTIIPIIEDEVNHGKNFANLRQIYNSMLLAAWYKKRLKESVLGQAYADQNNVNGIKMDNVGAHGRLPAGEAGTPIEEIWQKYVDTFKAGAADLIQEDYDPASGEIVARKYFVGGFAFESPIAALPAMLTPAALADFANRTAESNDVVVDLASVAEESIKEMTDADWLKVRFSLSGTSQKSEEGEYIAVAEQDNKNKLYILKFKFQLQPEASGLGDREFVSGYVIENPGKKWQNALFLVQGQLYLHAQSRLNEKGINFAMLAENTKKVLWQYLKNKHQTTEDGYSLRINRKSIYNIFEFIKSDETDNALDAEKIYRVVDALKDLNYERSFLNTTDPDSDKYFISSFISADSYKVNEEQYGDPSMLTEEEWKQAVQQANVTVDFLWDEPNGDGTTEQHERRKVVFEGDTYFADFVTDIQEDLTDGIPTYPDVSQSILSEEYFFKGWKSKTGNPAMLTFPKLDPVMKSVLVTLVSIVGLGLLFDTIISLFHGRWPSFLVYWPDTIGGIGFLLVVIGGIGLVGKTWFEPKNKSGNSVDEASLVPGGIDLKEAAAKMQIQMSGDGEFVFPPVDPAMLEQIRTQGLVPVIRDIRTLDVPAIRLLLGLADTQDGNSETDYGSDSPALRPEEVRML